MNMDDFMLWTAEDSKVGIGPLTSSAIENKKVIRQNNHCMPAALNNQTVENVWKDIQKQSTADAAKPDEYHQQGQRQCRPQYPHQRQSTFGEMTLADFLVRTGIITDDPDAGSQTAESSSFCPSASAASVTNGFSPALDVFPSQDWTDFLHHPLQPRQLSQQAEAVTAAKRRFQPLSITLPTSSPVYDGLVDNASLGPDGFANTLALSPSFSDYSLAGRKRFSSAVVAEKTMERRQKRMIKNRESAARSRARKQQYTVELETEVTLLREENAMLKQQQALQQTHLSKSSCMQNNKMRVLKRNRSF